MIRATELERFEREADRISRELEVTPEVSPRNRKKMYEISDRLFSIFGSDPEGEIDDSVFEVPAEHGNVRVRGYRRPGGEARPALILLHGGGFWVGSTNEAINRASARRRALATPFAVFDIDYRLAPEDPYPAALRDVLAVAYWLRERAEDLNLDGRFAFEGISAGGNLAAATVLSLRDDGFGNVLGVVLVVPAVDLTPEGIPGGEDMVRAYGVSDCDDDPGVSPGRAVNLEGLPPIHILIAEFDGLRASAEAFVERLRESGNDVTATLHLGTIHGSSFLTGTMREARLWHNEVVAVLNDFVR
jgi:acetyl esterase